MKILNNFMGETQFIDQPIPTFCRSDGCIYILLNVHRFKHWSFQTLSFPFVYKSSQDLWYAHGIYMNGWKISQFHYMFMHKTFIHYSQKSRDKMQISGGWNIGLHRYCLVYTCPTADEYISLNSTRMKPRRTSQGITRSGTIQVHLCLFSYLRNFKPCSKVNWA